MGELSLQKQYYPDDIGPVSHSFASLALSDKPILLINDREANKAMVVDHITILNESAASGACTLDVEKVAADAAFSSGTTILTATLDLSDSSNEETLVELSLDETKNTLQPGEVLIITFSGISAPGGEVYACVRRRSRVR